MKDVKMEIKNVSAKEILQKKKIKVEKQRRYTKKRNNDNEMCHTSKGKKCDLGKSCECSQIEKSHNKSTYDTIQIDSNKCLHK